MRSEGTKGGEVEGRWVREMRAEGVGKKRRFGSFVLWREDVEEETLGG
jgi:hypothetical protein